MSQELLVCKGISKTYGEKQALKNIDLTLERGKIYGLIGRNGAGKTTLLSIISAQNPHTSGDVTIQVPGELENVPVWENTAALSHICFSRELSPVIMGNSANNMKVKEYLRVAALYYPNWDKGMEQELIEKFQLNVKQRISKLSKGMLSMVTIIVAMASKADFTFLDEPAAGLDVIAREFFYRRLLEEFAETNRTFVVSTHIIEEAESVFEEVIMIKDGELLLKENTEHLLERAYRVSGLAEQVEEAVRGYDCYHEENSGRSKSVTVMLKEGQEIPGGADITVQPLNLQNVFVALCGM